MNANIWNYGGGRMQFFNASFLGGLPYKKYKGKGSIRRCKAETPQDLLCSPTPFQGSRVFC